MSNTDISVIFEQSSQQVGTRTARPPSTREAARYIRRIGDGVVLLPDTPSVNRLGLAEPLQKEGVQVVRQGLRNAAPAALIGVTSADLALADTGTVIIESSNEDLRLATTLPEHHVILLDPRKIYADTTQAYSIIRQLHQCSEHNFLAFITGPSRTADIERVLTIGVHGPREVHILLLEEDTAHDPLVQRGDR